MKSTPLFFGGSLALLVLFGLGCQTPTPVLETGTPSTPVATTPANPPVIVPSGAATSTTTLPAIDDTWKTHMNQALGFTFQWPTKGRYAPQWEIKFAKQGDAAVTDGCYRGDAAGLMDKTERVTLNGIEFCHTSGVDAGAGNFYILDNYATLKGTQYVVLSFTKHTVNGGALDCHFADGITLSTSGTTCVPFEQNLYDAQLRQIVGTFAYTK